MLPRTNQNWPDLQVLDPRTLQPDEFGRHCSPVLNRWPLPISSDELHAHVVGAGIKMFTDPTYCCVDSAAHNECVFEST